MKKIILLILSLFLLVGCNSMDNTPKMKAEELLSKYNDLNDNVVADLDTKLNEAGIADDVLEDTRDLYKKQYKDMKYKIVDEKIDGDKATVTAKVTVYDFSKAKKEAEQYIDEHNDEFMTDNIVDDIKTRKYIIEKQKETTERTTQTITINLHKDNGKWKVDDLDESTIEKLHGNFENQNTEVKEDQ